MFRKIIEWTEGDALRARKFVLFMTVFVFLLITISVFGAGLYGLPINEAITTLYITLVGLMVSIYGFYTGTNASSDSSNPVIDKATDLIMDKLKSIK